MKGYFCYTKWAVALILTMVPTLGWADSLPSSPLWDMFQNLSFTPPTGDISVAYLAKMFGAVPGVPQLSVGNTIIGVIFGVFNAGILALSGVFLSYTITKVITETTMDGAAMGKSTTIWTAVRCALSTSLLVPQASGYSMVNGIIMWVVIQSIGLADMTWSMAMEYLKRGGSAYTPSTAIMDYSLINYDVDTGNPVIDNTNHATSVGSADVLRSLTCAYTVYGALSKSQSTTNKKLAKKANLTDDEQTQLNNSYKVIPENGNDFAISKDLGAMQNNDITKIQGSDCVVQFPYIKNEVQNNPLQNYGLNLAPSAIPQNLTGLCGTINYDVPVGTNYPERVARYRAAKARGLQSMISMLTPVAKQLVAQIAASNDSSNKLDPSTYVLYQDSKTGTSIGFLQDPGAINLYSLNNQTYINLNYTRLPEINWPLGADEMLSAAAQYQSGLATAQIVAQTFTGKATDDAFDKAKKQGWIGAGGYYRLLASVQDSVKMEYDSYRLTGYASLGNPFATTTIENRDANSPAYLDLFKQATTNMANSNKTAIGAIDQSYQTVLGNALTWIYLTYPYSKLHGMALAPSLSGINTGSGIVAGSLGGPSRFNLTLNTGIGFSQQGISNNGAGASISGSSLTGDHSTGSFNNGSVQLTVSSSPFESWGSSIFHATSADEGIIYGKVILGSILLGTVPPAAIPVLSDVPMDWLKFDVNKVFVTWDAVMNSQQNVDPIIKLQILGRQMMQSGMDYVEQLKNMFMTITVAVSGIALGLQLTAWAAALCSFWGVCQGISMAANASISLTNATIEMSQTIIFMNLPIGLAVIVPMIVSGAIFAIYVPLIPYLLFLFGVISWFISVLVLMASAPIICFLMLWGNSSQENPLLAREAEQFVMQIVGVFFRPTLMIIGLITGMVLSYIGVDVLNLGFANVVNTLIIVPFDTDSSNLQLIKRVGVLSIYTFTMVSLVNMCFSTIYLLYSEAMRVAGIQAPAVGLEAQQLEAVKGAATQLAEAGAGGMKESATSGKGARYAAPDPDKKKGGTGKSSGAEGGEEAGGETPPIA